MRGAHVSFCSLPTDLTKPILTHYHKYASLVTWYLIDILSYWIRLTRLGHRTGFVWSDPRSTSDRRVSSLNGWDSNCRRENKKPEEVIKRGSLKAQIKLILGFTLLVFNYWPKYARRVHSKKVGPKIFKPEKIGTRKFALLLMNLNPKIKFQGNHSTKTKIRNVWQKWHARLNSQNCRALWAFGCILILKLVIHNNCLAMMTSFSNGPLEQKMLITLTPNLSPVLDNC